MSTSHRKPTSRAQFERLFVWSVAASLVALTCWSRMSFAGEPFSILVFSKTAKYRHESIPVGIAAIKALGERHGFAVEATEDAELFAPATLERYRVIVFLNTTADVLDSKQQAAMERFVGGGRGFVGVHAAADTEYDWPWYGQLLGTYFKSHPPVQSATLHVVDASHASTRTLPADWTRADEWYDYREDPAANGVHVLLELDERSYQGARMGGRHPIAWLRDENGRRMWYTGLGHTVESYRDERFLEHLLGGILWAADASNAQ